MTRDDRNVTLRRTIKIVKASAASEVSEPRPRDG